MELLEALSDRLSSVVEAANALDELTASPERKKKAPARRRGLGGSGSSSSEDEEDLLPGPGAYDVQPTVVGKRVVGGKFGSSGRFTQASSGSGRLGPGNYQPNRSFVTRKPPSVRIAKPTAKALAEHVMMFEREAVERGLGPGKYSPDFQMTSERGGGRSARIAPPPRPALPLVKKLVEDAFFAAAPPPGTYDPDYSAVRRRKQGPTAWVRPAPPPPPDPDDLPTPGPGAYDANLDSVLPRLAGQVRIAPEQSVGALSQASTLSIFGGDRDSEVPGPGKYFPDDDLVHPRSRSARIAPPPRLKSPFESDSDQEGDMLVLHPKLDATRRSVACSAVMREASFASQASTQPCEQPPLDPDISFLSTTRRSRAAHIGSGPTHRASDESASPPPDARLGPGRYDVRYSLVERAPRATEVLRSSAARENPWFPDPGADEAREGDRLVLDPLSAGERLRTRRAVPDLARQADRPPFAAGGGGGGYTGDDDYDVEEAEQGLRGHMPGVDFGRLRGRFEPRDREGGRLPGPGAYDVDDALVRERARSAFVGTAGLHECEEEEGEVEGDVLELDVLAAEAATRGGLRGAVAMDRQAGRTEQRKDEVPEALDYSPDDRAVRAHVRGFDMEALTGRGEEEEEDRVWGKYKIDYTHTEPRSGKGVVDFGRAAGTGREEEGGGGERREGDVLLLRPERGDAYLRVTKGVPDMQHQSDRPDFLAVESAYTGTRDYDADPAVLLPHMPAVDLAKFAGRKEPKGQASEQLGPGAYDVDDALVRERARSAFVGTAGLHECDGDGEVEGDVLELDVLAAEAATRGGVRGVVAMDKQAGRREERTDQVPEALDYSPDDRAVRAHVRGFDMETLTGREEEGDEEEEDRLFGKYTPRYGLTEQSLGGRVVDFGKTTGREEAEDEERREGDVLLLRPERADAYLKAHRGAPDLARQTDRAALFEAESAFTGEGDYDIDGRALQVHVPAVDLAKATGRKESKGDRGMEALGPGAYDVDDALVRERARSAFVGTAGLHECEEEEGEVEGDVLELDVLAAEAATRGGVRGVVAMDKQIGRREAKHDEEFPEALDYSPDDRAVRAHVRGFDMEALTGREEEELEEDKVFGKYTPNFATVERSAPEAAEFARQVGRVDVELEGRREGDVLLLNPERADAYLRAERAVPDMHKMMPRSDAAVASAYTGRRDYEPNLGAVHAHTPAVDFSKAVARPPLSKAGAEDEEHLGPGCYSPRDAMTHARAVAAVIHPLGEGGEGGEEGRREGDVLVLHPEKADELTRPVAPRTVITVPALETEWAQRRVTVGDGLELPSIKERLDASRIDKLLTDWSRPDFYDVDEGLVRRSAYTESAVDMSKQPPRNPAPKLGIVLAPAQTSRGARSFGGLPVIGSILKGAIADLCGGLRVGDEVGMLTRSDGSCLDVRKWAREGGKTRTGAFPKEESTKVLSRLGDWRECEDKKGATFFHNCKSGKKVWRFPGWRDAELVCDLLTKEFLTAGFPLKLHVRRRPQLTTLIPITLKNIDDVAFGAYQPKHDLTEAAAKGISDFTRIVGRDEDPSSKVKMDLFKRKLLYDMKRTIPSEILVDEEDGKTDEEMEMQERHDREVEDLRRLQARERKEQMLKIYDIVQDVADQEGGAEGVREKLEREVDQRYEQERKELYERQGAERQGWEEGRERARVVKVDKKVLEREIEKVVHQHAMKLDTALRLKETEVQRRRRHTKDAAAGTRAFSAQYSDPMPSTDPKYIDNGKTSARADVRSLSQQDVEDWKRHTAYKGLRSQDQVVKWFWQILESWSPKRRSLVLQLCTGTAAVPKGGFATLSGHHISSPDGCVPFSIRRMPDKLLQKVKKEVKKGECLTPRAFAPMNRLYLPEYRSKLDVQRGLEGALAEMERCESVGVGQGGGTLLNDIMCRRPGEEAGFIFTIMEDED